MSRDLVEAKRLLREQEALRAFLRDEGVPTLDAEELAVIQGEWRKPARKTRRGAKRGAT